MHLLQTENKSRRNVNHINMCWCRCLPYFTFCLDTLNFLSETVKSAVILEEARRVLQKKKLPFIRRVM